MLNLALEQWYIQGYLAVSVVEEKKEEKEKKENGFLEKQWNISH